MFSLCLAIYYGYASLMAEDSLGDGVVLMGPISGVKIWKKGDYREQIATIFFMSFIFTIILYFL
jgi:hypothetical protein